jgi:parvulin-like peptidyl-prolyl isomerase
MNRRASIVVVLAALTLTTWVWPSRAELVEEIVAWVNGDIITWSEYDEEEKAMVAEAYRQMTGDELDTEVTRIREGLLQQMIDRKILLNHAQLLYNTDRMTESFYEGFKQQQMELQGIESDEEFERRLANDGMTVDDLKRKLLEMFAPDEVIRFEVGGRLAVSDTDLRAYYDSHQEEFTIAAEVTVREIVLLADTDDEKEKQLTEALRIRREATDDAEFADLAKEYSQSGTAATGGLLGPLKRGDLSAQLEAVAFDVPVGEVSQVLDMPYGYHMIMVESRAEDELTPFDEIKDKLRLQLEDRQYFTDLREFMDQARTEAEWCVKPKFRKLLPEESPECETF